MLEQFESIISTLIQPKKQMTFSIFDPAYQLDGERTDDAGVAQALNAAFLITLAGSMHPALERAKGFMARMKDSSEWVNKAN